MLQVMEKKQMRWFGHLVRVKSESETNIGSKNNWKT